MSREETPAEVEIVEQEAVRGMTCPGETCGAVRDAGPATSGTAAPEANARAAAKDTAAAAVTATPRPKARELYPLPQEERKALVRATVLSEAMIAGAAIVGAFVLTGLQTGDWLGSLGLGWAAAIGQKLMFHWAIFVLPVILTALVIAIDEVGQRKSATYREAMQEVNKGINGELPRTRLGDIVLFAVLAGICEELLFRYVLMGLLLFVFGLFLPPLPAAVLTVVLATAVFGLVHFQYRNAWSISVVLCLSLILCLGYLLSGSLLAVMVAHAVYNASIMLRERRQMVEDPDYFGGPAPVNVVRDMMSASGGGGAAEGSGAKGGTGEARGV